MAPVSHFIAESIASAGGDNLVQDFQGNPFPQLSATSMRTSKEQPKKHPEAGSSELPSYALLQIDCGHTRHC